MKSQRVAQSFSHRNTEVEFPNSESKSCDCVYLGACTRTWKPNSPREAQRKRVMLTTTPKRGNTGRPKENHPFREIYRDQHVGTSRKVEVVGDTAVPHVVPDARQLLPEEAHDLRTNPPLASTPRGDFWFGAWFPWVSPFRGTECRLICHGARPIRLPVGCRLQC